MTGVLATVRLMFTALSLQRWLAGAGALLALLGAAGMIADALGSPSVWAPLATIMSGVLLVISPCFLGGPLLRHLASSRAVRLLPHGRLQLFLGSLLTQLLIAAIAAATVAAFIGFVQLHERLRAGLLTSNGAAAAVFVVGFGMASLLFITMYYGSGHRLGFLGLLGWALLVRGLSVAFPHCPAREFIASTRGLVLVFVGISSLWALFAVAYLRAGRIAPPALGGSGDERIPLIQWLAARDGDALIATSGRNATRLLLTGKYFGRRITRPLLGIGAGVLCWYFVWTLRSNPVLELGKERVLAVINAYGAAVAAAASIQPMIGRARYLWLKALLDRGQLFRAVETESWRTLLSISPFGLAISAYLCLLAQVPIAVVTEILLLSFVSGGAMIYLVLLSTRGWRLIDASLITALSALWMFGLLQSMAGDGGSRLLLLLMAELLLIPLLRAWARSRWLRIDWVVNRASRMMQRPIGGMMPR